MSEPPPSGDSADTGRNGRQQRSAPRAWRERAHRHRERLRRHRTLNTGYRAALGIGGVGLLCGVVLVPYPVPGWLTVFAALSILASEFHWARRISDVAGRYYARWTRWLGNQRRVTQAAVAVGTGLIVRMTLWLLGVLGMVGTWFGVDWEWLRSPALGH